MKMHRYFSERSIALGPNLVEAYFELGHAFWLSGKRELAHDMWEQGGQGKQIQPLRVNAAMSCWP